MASLLEPPPLLALLIVLASAGLALWLGLGRRSPRTWFTGGERQAMADTADEDAEEWGSPEPAPPPRQPYVYASPGTEEMALGEASDVTPDMGPGRVPGDAGVATDAGAPEPESVPFAELMVRHRPVPPAPAERRPPPADAPEAAPAPAESGLAPPTAAPPWGAGEGLETGRDEGPAAAPASPPPREPPVEPAPPPPREPPVEPAPPLASPPAEEISIAEIFTRAHRRQPPPPPAPDRPPPPAGDERAL